jgi:glycosyltransferase involved in cell wall biosynthesis
MHVSLIVPVHDQEGTIAEDVWVLSQQVARVSPDWELVVVDRGSRDRTPEILERMRAQEPRLILICHARARGLGEGWRSALMRARGEVLVVLDRPGEWDLSRLGEMVARLEDCDVWAGYRRRAVPEKGRGRAGWALRAWLGLDPRLLDAGVFIMRRELLQRIGLEEKEHWVALELAARAMRAGLVVELGPVPFFARQGSRPAQVPKLRELWGLRRRVWREVPSMFTSGHEMHTARLRLEFLYNPEPGGEGQLALER